MRRARLAELLLSLATTPDRAAAIAGDLIESTDGNIWLFWPLVLQTALCQSFRQMATSPFQMARIAARVWLQQFLLMLAISMGFAAEFLISHFVFHRPLSSGFGQDVYIGILFMEFSTDFLIGRWMARRYPGRELAGCISLMILNFAIVISAALLVWATLGARGVAAWHMAPTDWLDGGRTAGSYLLDFTLLLCGASFGRRRKAR